MSAADVRESLAVGSQACGFVPEPVVQSERIAEVIDLDWERQRRFVPSSEQWEVAERNAARLRHPSVRGGQAASVRVETVTVSGRLVARVLGYLAAVAVVVVGGGLLGLMLRPDAYAGPTWEHSVSAGESLWSVAQGIQTERAIEDVVEDIRQLNGLSTDALQVGQELILPAQ